MRGYIYKITNTINGKFYIGSRRCETLAEAKQDNYFGSGVALYYAIRKYGKENFTKQIIAFVDNAYEYEETILQNIDAASNPNCYNMKNAGIGMDSQFVKKQWQDPEYRAMQSVKMKKQWQSPEYRAMQSARLLEMNKVRWQNDEQRIKQGIKTQHQNKKMWQDPEFRAKMSAIKSKKVLCVNYNICFASAKAASEWCGGGVTGVTAVARGERKIAGRHPQTGEPLQWRYIDENVV